MWVKENPTKEGKRWAIWLHAFNPSSKDTEDNMVYRKSSKAWLHSETLPQDKIKTNKLTDS